MILIPISVSAYQTTSLNTQWGSIVLILPDMIRPLQSNDVFYSLTPQEPIQITEDVGILIDRCLAGTCALFMDMNVPHIKGLLLFTHTDNIKYWIYKRGVPVEPINSDEFAFWDHVGVSKIGFMELFLMKAGV